MGYCAGVNTLAKDCGSKWKKSAQTCCNGLVCDDYLCVVPDNANTPTSLATEPPTLASTPKSTSKATNGITPLLSEMYIGCFNDNKNGERDLPEYIGVVTSTDQCLKKCKQAGYKYLGRQWYNECWCGNEYGSQG